MLTLASIWTDTHQEGIRLSLVFSQIERHLVKEPFLFGEKYILYSGSDTRGKVFVVKPTLCCYTSLLRRCSCQCSIMGIIRIGHILISFLQGAVYPNEMMIT